ncbi:MAG: hypothetical protein AAF919_02770 [Pseudomonadota bacterium]
MFVSLTDKITVEMEALGITDATLYVLATVGAVSMAWGSGCWAIGTARFPARSAMLAASAVGFAGLCLMRVWALLDGGGFYLAVRPLLYAEVAAFCALALWSVVRIDGWARFGDMWTSLLGAKIWIQIWIWLGLLPANLAAFWAFWATGHPVAAVAMIGFSFILIWNMALALIERGISKATSIPHAAWIPSVVMAIWWLANHPEALAEQGLLTWAWIHVVVHLISLGFDAPDGARWVLGDREVIPPRASNAAPTGA